MLMPMISPYVADVFGFVNHSVAGMATSTTCVIDVPTGAKIGDLLVAVTALTTTSGTQTPPSGWTEHRDESQRTVSSFIWDGANSSYTFTASVANESGTYSGVMTVFRKAAFDVAGTVSTNTPDPLAPSITISAANAIQVVNVGVTNNTARTYTPASGFTEICDLNTESPALGALAVKYKTGVASGSTGTVQYVSDDNAGHNRAWQFSVIEA